MRDRQRAGTERDPKENAEALAAVRGRSQTTALPSQHENKKEEPPVKLLKPNDFIQSLITFTSMPLNSKSFSEDLPKLKEIYNLIERNTVVNLDALDHVVTTYRDSKIEAPTVHRDATKALDLDKRLPANDPQKAAQHLILRALSTLRGIDHTFEFLNLPEGRKELLSHFLTLLQDINKGKDLKEVERNFNTSLFRVLHYHHLTNGIKDAKNAEKLLFHYRNLASTLEPAETAVTVVKTKIFDEEKEEELDLIATETCYPITKKTDKQKEQIAQMSGEGRARTSQSDSKSDAPSEDRSSRADAKSETGRNSPQSLTSNFHSKSPEAFQIANRAFASLIARPDTSLPAQTRKTIAPTVKNGYLVKNEVVFTEVENPKNIKKGPEVTYSLRCGSPVYVGKGESEEKLKEYTTENMQQLREMAATIKGPDGNPLFDQMHLTMLLTDSKVFESQHLILDITKKVADQLHIVYSNTPTNLQGATTQDMTVAASVSAAAEKNKLDMEDLSKTALFTAPPKKKRIFAAATVANTASSLPKTINVVFCASGQDRTGTLLELAMQLWCLQVCMKLGIKKHDPKISLDDARRFIESMRAKGLHNAFMASFTALGSHSLKSDSHVKELFSAITDDFFYTSIAKTNKSAPVNEDEVTSILATAPTARKIAAEQPAAQEKKEDIKSEDANKLLTQIRIMLDGYSGSHHKKEIDQMRLALSVIEGKEKSANKLGQQIKPHSKLSNLLEQIVKIFWNPGAEKYKGTDNLIATLNRESTQHSTLRNFGELLQTYVNKFPVVADKLKQAGFNPRIRILPAQFSVESITQEQIETLCAQLDSYQKKLKTPNPDVAQALRNLEAKKSPETFSNAVVVLNNIWIKHLKDEAGMFKTMRNLMTNTSFHPFEESQKLIAKLESDPNKSPEKRALATILQSINETFPDKLMPPIKNFRNTDESLKLVK